MPKITAKYLFIQPLSFHYSVFVERSLSGVIAYPHKLVMIYTVIAQYSSDKTKTLVETAIYRVLKTQSFYQ
ncbi:MAG: hypothetical protein V7K38_21815 [Nostoc sp.]|uniref:hypothetical protein n=1 Tax=Nostoc sp. TaxID=1180 RepID=UPI002FF6A333